MNRRQTEQRARTALDALAPRTTFEDIAQQVSSAPHERSVVPMTKKKSTRILKFALPAVAACLLLVAGLLGGGYYADHVAVDAVIDLDVNPGIELELNRQQEVLSATACNEDGAYILDGMQLEDTELKVAVNALIGSMVQKGYVVNDRSGILVSVQHKDADRAQALRQQVVSLVDDTLSRQQVDAPVINQTVTEDEAVRLLAQQTGISVGKAAFVHNLVALDDTLDAQTLATMSLRSLTALVVERGLDISTFADYDKDDSVWENIEEAIEDGDETAPFTITVDAAKAAALKHAGLTTAQVTKWRSVERDVEEGVPVYEVEFFTGDAQYDYVIHGATGQVLKVEKDTQPSNTLDTSPTTARYIGLEAAKAAALKHAGVAAGKVRLVKAELDRDDGVYYYDVEFVVGTMEYEYEIHATSGQVLQAAKERDEDAPTVTATTQAKPTGLITVAAAKAAALKHAGLTAEKVVFEDVELEDEARVPYYEVEFVSGRMEYSYNIDAYTGNVLKAEKEMDD